MKKITELSDFELAQLVDNRWNSSESVWDVVTKTYDRNVAIYKNEPEWLTSLPKKKSKVRANRIFVDMEAVINAVIANPPRMNILCDGKDEETREMVLKQERYFQIKYDERNVKEAIRKGLRNLYFARLIVLKPFWDAKINDFNVRAIDPRKVRFGKHSTKEDETEFAIEEIDDNLLAVLRRFPKKKDVLLAHYGYETEEDVLIRNPQATYQEAWIRDHVIFKLSNIILGVIKNPYWDWDGLLVTPEEDQELQTSTGDARRNALAIIKDAQDGRKARLAKSMQDMPQTGQAPAATPPGAPQPPPPGGAPVPTPYPVPQPSPVPDEEAAPVSQGDIQGDVPMLEGQEDPGSLRAYFYNHFDQPRKPYIFATMFNNENSPIGQTDRIAQAIPLQENIDERKRDITENAKIMNGTILVDSTVMDKADAQRLRYEAGGVIWGKGVVAGVKRETGPALPAFVIEDMQDSRAQIDDLMAASAAFRGQREGQETAKGRLALVDQSFQANNELVQVIDYVCREMFEWFYQLAKVKYTEHHYAKLMGKEDAIEEVTLMQDDFYEGAEIRIIAGKTLPVDREFKYEQAQQDVQKGYIAPIDYLEIAGYDSPKTLAKNAFMSRVAPATIVGLTAEDRAKIPPPLPVTRLAEQIHFVDLPPAGKVQFLERMGIQVTEKEIVSHEIVQSVLDGAAKGRGMDAPPDTETRAETDDAAGEGAPVPQATNY